MNPEPNKEQQGSENPKGMAEASMLEPTSARLGHEYMYFNK